MNMTRNELRTSERDFRATRHTHTARKQIVAQTDARNAKRAFVLIALTLCAYVAHAASVLL